ncbi:MAG TPA: hypothetical protein V6D19_17770 [Stenomitos sp.]
MTNPKKIAMGKAKPSFFPAVLSFLRLRFRPEVIDAITIDVCGLGQN